MPNVIEEYLVSLGFSSDENSLRKLQGTLGIAEKAVESHTFGMARKLLEAQGAIVGAFTSISAVILGTVDKVAMADQGYRLMGLHMLMSTEQARKLDIVTKALGATMEEIMYDPELRARAGEVSEHIDRLTQQLGPGFEGSMKSVRDFRQQFTLLGVDAKFLGMQFASNLFSKLVPGDSMTEKLSSVKKWVNDFEAKIPKIADSLSGYAIPVLKQTYEILASVGGAAKEFGVLFTNVVGLLSNDRALSGATFSFSALAGAIGHVGEWVKDLFVWITDGEKALVGFSGSLARAITRIRDDPKGIWDGLKNETASAFNFVSNLAEKNFSKILGNIESWINKQATSIMAMLSKVLDDASKKLEAQLGVMGRDLYNKLPGWMKTLLGPGFAATEDKAPSKTPPNTLKDHGFPSTKPPAAVAGILMGGAAGAGIGSIFGGVGALPGMGIGAVIGLWRGLHFGEQEDETRARALLERDQVLRDNEALRKKISPASQYWPKLNLLSSSPEAPSSFSIADRIIGAISKVEAGKKPNPISERNNNPGNL